MTTTPTRQDVLDALLADRINWSRHTSALSFNDQIDVAARVEMELTDAASYEAMQCAVLDRYHHGAEVLEDWRLVQGETFDARPGQPGHVLHYGHMQQLYYRGAVGYLLETFGGYIPTCQNVRYVGLAPR